MELSQTSAIDKIKSPTNKANIQSVKDAESQLRVFTEEMKEHELKREHYWGKFLSTMKERSHKKYKRVLQFARYPLPVVDISDSILTDFFKVFDGKNRFFNVEGDRNIEVLNEWISQNTPDKWIQENAMKVYKNKPNSFVVVDVDAEGKPYLILIDSERLIDAEFKKDGQGQLEYIVFIHSQEVVKEGKESVVKTLFSVYDDLKYYVFSKLSNQDSYNLERESLHNIGYCPARSFVSTSSNSQNKFMRRIAFSSSLSKLEDWQYFDIFRNYVDHYAPFPVTEAPKKACPNPQCNDGFISEEVIVDPINNITETKLTTCPTCQGGDHGQHVYPGTHIGIKVNANAKKDGSGVFRMIFPETDKLEYVPNKLDKIELEVRLKTVGINNMIGKEAINEMQIKGSFASMETILLRTKDELDQLYKWIVQTVGNVFYLNLNLKIEANFGTEFYLISEEDLQKRFDNAKKIGMPLEEQLNIYKQLLQTKYKGNQNKLERSIMLLDLDPFPMMSIEEVLKLLDKSVLDKFEVNLKVNFLKFISQFESENVDITQFGVNLDYSSRIDRIKKELYLYNQEMIDERGKRTENEPNPNPEPPNPPIEE